MNIVKRKKRQVVELTDRDAAYDVLEKEETIKVGSKPDTMKETSKTVLQPFVLYIDV